MLTRRRMLAGAAAVAVVTPLTSFMPATPTVLADRVTSHGVRAGAGYIGSAHLVSDWHWAAPTIVHEQAHAESRH